MKILGAITGAISGVFLGYQKIHFRVAEKPRINILKFVAGMAVVLLLKSGLKPVLNGMFGLLFGSFLRYTAILFWIFGLYPFIFTNLLKSQSLNND